MKMAFRYFLGTVALFLGIVGLLSLRALIDALIHRRWDAATAYAALPVGLSAAGVVVWQGYVIKRQLAFSTYLDLDKEWNSEEMIKARKNVRAPDSTEWNQSHLEAILEFFEKLAFLFKVSGDMTFVYRSTLGWYAAQYFLFASEHGQIKHLRELWKDDIYQDIEALYNSYVGKEAGRSQNARKDWKDRRLATEQKFWKQERKD